MKLKNFRRVAALGMAVGMTAVLAACGNTADTASSEAAESTAETADTAEKASAETADAEYAYLADFSFSDAFDENGYLKGVTATDYVTLPDDYADITISADLGQVSDDDINDYIDSNVLSNFATTNESKTAQPRTAIRSTLTMWAASTALLSTAATPRAAALT